ncbi:cupin domain-containing protein [Chryseobacterium sp. HR92]|uniref:(R)-mandelonitrile lyase n=1 Tax=Chryseobacterium sp. HR92 TaxID=3094839 RepID=UPI003890D50C|nr:cupin domain-containing protein [Chryseobacterium sp. HR92]
MKHVVILLLSVLLLSSCCTKSILEGGKTYIFPKGEKVTNNNFTGNVWLKMLGQDEQLLTISIGNVTFEPGARTKWHLHPGGQIILVTDGIGYYQEKGQMKKILHKGDVIKCPPNVVHWHGASPDSHLVHLAISDNDKGAVMWLEPVTDEEFYK